MGSKSNMPQLKPVASFDHIESPDRPAEAAEWIDQLIVLRRDGANESDVAEAKLELEKALGNLKYEK